MAVERELTIGDYIKIVRRRAPYALGFFLLTLPLATGVALKISPVYQAGGTILLESQQVQPGVVTDVAETFATQRIEAIKQVVLTRENLVGIAHKYKLFGLEKDPEKFFPDALAVAMRSHSKVDLIKADSGNWGEKTTLAFNVSFQYYKPDVTYAVTNDLIKLFLDENEKAAKTRAIETADFLSKEAEKQKIALEKIESEITAYKQRHSRSLPQNKELQVSSLQRLENDLRATQREYSATQAELRSLDVSLESAKAGIGLAAAPDQQRGPAAELEKLRQEQAKLTAIYSDNHPSVRAIQRKIDTLEKTLASRTDSGSSKPMTPQSAMVAKIQAQIDTAHARLATLQSEENGIRAQIRQIEGLVSVSAQTEGELGVLQRNYENAKSSYEEIKAKLTNARMAKNLEMENKGERFVLIEAPLLPDKPFKPNRILLLLAAFLGSAAGGVGLAFLLEKLDKRVRGVDNLASIMQLQPIVAIPYIETKAEVRKRNLLIFNVLFGIFVVVAVALLVVHYFLMPLGDVFAKIMTRF